MVDVVVSQMATRWAIEKPTIGAYELAPERVDRPHVFLFTKTPTVFAKVHQRNNVNSPLGFSLIWIIAFWCTKSLALVAWRDCHSLKLVAILLRPPLRDRLISLLWIGDLILSRVSKFEVGFLFPVVPPLLPGWLPSIKEDSVGLGKSKVEWNINARI